MRPPLAVDFVTDCASSGPRERIDAAPAAVECRVTGIVEQGDHHIVVGEVVEAHLPKPISGRPDVAILEMKDLGDNVFYGG